MSLRNPGPGRPPKFKLGTIVTDTDNNLYVIVDHQVRGTKSQYRCIPTNNRFERFGGAAWIESNKIEAIGKRSAKGSLVTYRANEMLEREGDGRGCRCQCCVHEAMPRNVFNKFTGELKDWEDE